MQQVFKCDHCSHTNVIASDVAKHEAVCSFNEQAKQCFTCVHLTDEGYPISGTMWACNVKCDVHSIMEGDSPCPSHQGGRYK